MRVDDELEIKAYYAGHVLGAAMFHVRVGNQSVVYTVSADESETIWSIFYHFERYAQHFVLFNSNPQQTTSKHMS